LTGEGSTNELTQVGITLGTPLYMSPEQVEGKPLDPRSDIYSFGVTCYHMLSGSPPFRGETALGVAVQHLKKQPEPLESLRGDLPPALCRIVHQMLAKDPAQRFATARDLLRELRRVQIEHFGDDWPEDLPAWDSQVGETSVDLRMAATQQLAGLMKTMALQRRRRRSRAWFAAGLFIAFALGGLGAWYAVVPPSWLAEAQTAPQTVPKQPTVILQWYRASDSNTEAAWQSVITYFPEKTYFTLRAKQQLALIYLHNDDYDRAMKVFDELAKLGDDEEELRAFGLAGKCGILSIGGNYRESAEVLSQFAPNKLTSEPMRSLVRHAIERNRSKLNLQTAPAWDKWLDEQSRDGS
jgi:eukaryotic-like serine/threonine-protein kinase